MRPIEFPEFTFSSPLAKVIVDLERLRGDLGSGTTHPTVFIQLKALFQLMTSIVSARIEGNRTSIVDAVQGVAVQGRRHGSSDSEGVTEIVQLQEAASFIDRVVEPGTPLTHGLVRELHKIAVAGLDREGDKTPGVYRTSGVTIGGSQHVPPSPIAIQADMSELLDFVNGPVEQSYDLLKTAIAHHRFVWIHPFGNGNGRVCRLFTYAMLVSLGFTAATGYRALNPTAVFGADRSSYYQHLEDADSLEPDAVVRWCTYLLEGMRNDLERLKRLSDNDFVVDSLLRPAIRRAMDSGHLSVREAKALVIVAEKTEVKAADLEPAFPGSSAVRSQQIRRLLDRHMISPVAEGKRTYQLVMAPGDLTPFVIRQLDELGFLPTILRENFG